MPEPLKNIFTPKLLGGFAEILEKTCPGFSPAPFLARVFDPGWEALELKQRMRHISHCLGAALPAGFPQAAHCLVKTTQRLIDRQGEKLAFEYCFLPDFIEVYGLEHPDAALSALETITRWSSAEFAVRPFLIRYPEPMYAQMLAWSVHPSPMVRRLASEGFRPRLPWGMGVPALKRDPSPTLPVLENLKADPAETVRRSVANHLNDISKDHPDLALQLARRWYGQSPETDWVVRHALRGLLKKGRPEALALFGFEQAAEGLEIEQLEVPEQLRIGDTLEFAFLVKNTGNQDCDIRLEYGIDYRTGTGKISRKIFKIKEIRLEVGASAPVRRSQRFTDFTTRKHYAGAHRLRILVNGRELAGREFELTDG